MSVRNLLSQRVISAGCYLVPAWARLLLARRSALREHHAFQATGLGFLLGLLVFGYAVAFLVLSAAMVLSRSTSYLLQPVVEWGFGALFVLWLLLFLTGSALALLGSTKRLPLAFALGSCPGLRRWMVAASLAGTVAVGAIALMAVRSTKLARDFDQRPAKVAVLYDDMGFVPRWVMTLGCYRLAIAAIDRWGEGSVVVAPITTEALHGALARSTLVYLATHGTSRDGGVAWGSRQLVPEDVGHSVRTGPELRFVYLTACDGGAGEAGKAWEEAFAPARVITFDRLSVNVEHAWWLWFESPAVVASLP